MAAKKKKRSARGRKPPQEKESKGSAPVQRWIGSCRRELLDLVVPLNEGHLLRLVREYVAYYHHDRTHLGLEKDAPVTRSVTARPSSRAQVVALPRVGGLHRRYVWRQAA